MLDDIKKTLWATADKLRKKMGTTHCISNILSAVSVAEPASHARQKQSYTPVAP
jgi:hypothetical protein